MRGLLSSRLCSVLHRQKVVLIIRRRMVGLRQFKKIKSTFQSSHFVAILISLRLKRTKRYVLPSFIHSFYLQKEALKTIIFFLPCTQFM